MYTEMTAEGERERERWEAVRDVAVTETVCDVNHAASAAAAAAEPHGTRSTLDRI